jgi:hypothetical protein
MAAVDTAQSSKLFVFNYDDVVYPRDNYFDRTVRPFYPCVNAPFVNPPYWTLADYSSDAAQNFTSCMLQSGQQWRPVGGCFGGSGADQVCSNRGQMSPLSKVQFGTLDDDFNGANVFNKWIFTDYGRTVVMPAKPDGQYVPAMPYLQNGFALLQIAVQEVCERRASIISLISNVLSQAAKSLACVLQPCTKSPFKPTQIFPYPTPDMLWGMTSQNLLSLIIFLCGWPIYFTYGPLALAA